MSGLSTYRRREKTAVIAVQIALQTDGFTYTKWGGEQRACAGDWLVNNAGDVYTVEQSTFERTYREVSPGSFVKSKPVWAKPADEAGVIKTKEGQTAFEAGDMIVFNDPDEQDGYAMTKETFDRLYEPAD